jgi:hypothetical protein
VTNPGLAMTRPGLPCALAPPDPRRIDAAVASADSIVREGYLDALSRAGPPLGVGRLVRGPRTRKRKRTHTRTRATVAPGETRRYVE